MKAIPRGARPISRICLNVPVRPLVEAVEVSFRIKKTNNNKTPTNANEPAMVTVETVDVVTVEIISLPPKMERKIYLSDLEKYI
jgi:hypothetical protein